MSRAIVSLPGLLLLVTASCGAEPEERHPDVLLLVIDPLRAVVEVENFSYATSQLAQTTLRSVLGQAEMDDLLAELRRHDLMTLKGVFADKQYVLTIDPDRGITFTRLDASNLAQAKAANTSGEFIVMRHLDVRPCDV